MKRQPTVKPNWVVAFIITSPLWLIMALFVYCFLTAIFTGGYSQHEGPWIPPHQDYSR